MEVCAEHVPADTALISALIIAALPNILVRLSCRYLELFWRCEDGRSVKARLSRCYIQYFPTLGPAFC